MTQKFLIILSTLAFLILPHAAVAASHQSTTCNADQDVFDVTKDLFVGNWAVDVKQGILKGLGRTIPLPPPPAPDVVTMFMENGELMGKSAAVQTPYQLNFYIGPDWDMTPQVGNPVEIAHLFTNNAAPLLDDEDISVVAGCDANNLLRLTAEGTVVDPGSGSAVNFTLRLFVVNLDLMYGTTNGNVGPMTAIRAIVMSR